MNDQYRAAIEAGRAELHRLFHEEHGNDARELIRDNDGQYINEKTRDVWDWCEKIIMASLAHARKQQEGRDHLRGTTEMIDPQGCRERFEATWANSCCVNDEATLRKGGVFDRDEYDGKYWNNHLESCWKLWQACEAAMQQSGGRVEEAENGKERGDA